MVRKVIRLLLLVMVWPMVGVTVVTLSGYKTAEAFKLKRAMRAHKRAPVLPIVPYNIQLFKSDRVLIGPVSQYSYYFEVRPEMHLIGNCFLDLVYSQSETIVPDRSVMTVMLNDIPVTSWLLKRPIQMPTRRRIQLPAMRILQGWNEIRITIRQRTIEGYGLCQDVDNDVNWVRLWSSSVLHLESLKRRSYPLYVYPYPCLDLFSTELVRCTLYLPANPSTDEVEAILHVASNLGLRSLGKSMDPLPLRVSTIDPNVDTGNQILIGEWRRWPDLAVTNLYPRTGWLLQVPRSSQKGTSRLYISGADSVGVSKAQAALSHPEMVAQMETNSCIVKSFPKEVMVEEPSRHPGQFTLKQLGYPYINLVGAFHARTNLVIKRPVRWSIGADSYIKLHFRHSATLDPRRSLLTVYLDKRPLGSVVLGPKNAKGDTLMVKIPPEELNKDAWTLGLACFHDLGHVDCSKRYDEVAWTVIEGDSYIYFSPGYAYGGPSLAGFPHMMMPDGRVAKEITVCLPSHPSDQELSVAATIASRAAQNARVPLRWRVIMGDIPEKEMESSYIVIIIGKPKDMTGWTILRGRIPVWPSESGRYEIDHNLNLIPEQISGAAILQAVDSPWNKQGVAYIVIVHDDAACARLRHVLTNIDLLNRVTGQVCLISPLGRIISLNTIAPKEKKKYLVRELGRIKGIIYRATGLTFLALAVLSIWTIRRIGRKRGFASGRPWQEELNLERDRKGEMQAGKISNVAEVERLTKLPVLGVIPSIRENKRNMANLLVSNLGYTSAASESYRSLRTNLLLASVQQPIHTLMIMSPGTQEGRSLTVANLGIVMAKSGLRTLIVDSDLYKPIQRNLFGIDGDPGLTDVLKGKIELDKAIKPTNVENLFIITSGQIPPNPADLLSSEEMSQLIGKLRAEFDMVLFDAPPLLPEGYPVRLGTKVDQTILVIRYRKTSTDMVIRGMERLNRSEIRVIGVVLNDVPVQEG